MRGMILAAGFGERMRPLTDHTPKPLLAVAGKPLIEHHILSLVSAGFTDLVINISHLAEQIVAYCGDGRQWGASIQYSREETPLETAGGIAKALPLLGDEPFLVVNGDVWTDFDFNRARKIGEKVDTAHLILVDNAAHHPTGDFELDANGKVQPKSQAGTKSYTFAGIAVYRPAFFAELANVSPSRAPLKPLLDAAIQAQCLTADYYQGLWEDVGTPERLQDLERRFQAGASGD